jgi:hypothetical protein
MIEEPKHPAPVDLDEQRQRESDRFRAIHCDRKDLDELAAEIGTPDDWLWTAISHLKVQTSAAIHEGRQGTIEVSSSAVTLLIAKLEELLVGGRPWPWPEEEEA